MTRYNYQMYNNQYYFIIPNHIILYKISSVNDKKYRWHIISTDDTK